jgi:hypothetical protein
MSADAVFVDTSIQISRRFKSDHLKSRIEDRLSKFDLVLTGLVVRNEFRRRVMSEAVYLLRLLEKYKSAKRVHEHVNDELGGWQNQRKRNISLNLLTKFYPEANDAEHTDILRRSLRSLLIAGLDDFDESVDSVIYDSCCACGHESVREIEAYKKYNIGNNSCKAAGQGCGVRPFLVSKMKELKMLSDHLRKTPASEKSEEIQRIEQTLTVLLEMPEDVSGLELCQEVGDLLIALESSHIPTFYTQNVHESRHLCHALRQKLFYRDNHPANEDKMEVPENPSLT